MDHREDVLARTIEVVRKVVKFDSANPLGEEARFIEDLGVGSLDRVTLLIELEDSFGITITDDEAKRLQTIGDAVDLVVSAAAESERTSAT
ncbi:MAG TPA: phosphopantetheine-binding protein [Fibrobacteria bacterium]|nr:phosphopantetheine-binding protein [Fibrobacteria bacterium]